jgi:dipeptidyl aminopeptidase/acylaminoacyl peptidase
MSNATERFPLEELARLPEFYHPTASPDGDRVAMYYDGSGRNELCLLDPTSGELTQASDGNVPKDATYPIMWDPLGERVYFHHDEDGNEQNDIRAMELDGAAETVVDVDGQTILQDVTDDGRYLYYCTDAREQLNLYRHDTVEGESAQLTEYAQPVFSAAVSPDGERVAYVTNESENLENRDVYVADADGSNPRNLGIGEEGFEASVSDWSEGGELLVSDNTPDLTRTGIYDLESDEVEWFGPGECEESPVAFLPDGRGYVVLRTREAATMPIIYDREGSERQLDLPEGVASPPGYDEPFLEDSTVLLSHTTSNERSELLAYDLAVEEYETLKSAEYGDIDPDAFVPAEYVTYESHDDTEIGALRYDSGERPSPAVVMVHGGPHAQARKSFNPYVQFFLSRGYSVLQPNYRGSSGRGRGFKNAVHGDWGGAEQGDIAEGGRWLKSTEWIDEDGVAVFGGSYGGYSAYMQLVTYPTLWTTGISWVGITDLHALFEESMAHFKTTLREQMGDPEENHDFWRERSPIEHVEEMERPILMVHGVNDPRCPISQARMFRDALEARGWEEGDDGDFEYEELSEEGHGSTDQNQKVRAFSIIDDYLDRRL